MCCVIVDSEILFVVFYKLPFLPSSDTLLLEFFCSVIFHNVCRRQVEKPPSLIKTTKGRNCAANDFAEAVK